MWHWISHYILKKSGQLLVLCCSFKYNPFLFTQVQSSSSSSEPKMWTRVFSRLASPAVQRGACGVASRPRRTPRGPEWTQAPLPSPLPSLHLRGQQTLSSVSHPQVHHPVRSVRALNEERMVEVEWEDGGCSLYPFTWLRDNCQCPLCTLDSAQARKLLLSNVDINTGVDAVELTSDGHVSWRWFSGLCQLGVDGDGSNIC